MSDAKPDPVLTKQMQYIKVLEERNRIKKRLAAASKRNDRLHEREEAFVTAFNVPTRVAQSNSSSSSSGRTNKSAASVLPTKLAPYREQVRLTKCKSAPSTTLNFAGFSSGGGDEKGVDLRVRRAKWNRPQAPMNVAVEHHDGVRQFRLTTADDEDKDSEQKDADEYGDDEESYLEESFEEFEEEDVSEHSAQRPLMKELVIEEMEEEETVMTIPIQ
ncbi:hypothetical protein BBO99_00003931 [Phytophthora kernoviae]|uniref:Uncharacterized protein n=2 Tax=Phytophthora kernoviae TaxID=325452 RepID=A0A3R7H0P0_9STRA|nr:hypothetical protein G195_007312 [Phytophthora kernoviae 00238/432]KAG2521521.1 hypothetical protein JM16_003571 [Phytophthora kernoviae]KAG2522968.1 hypothetical protein JM18_003741 [Phytophthora kernoviae]RLN15016.1 hypothetical protein BBI17_003955 [Phytophthora kernoviae]RLN81188.1 hypothetical protein BBO99_00003931 [Phytophthora kernoviae]